MADTTAGRAADRVGWESLLRHSMAVGLAMTFTAAFLAFMGWMAVTVSDLRGEMQANQARTEKSIVVLEGNQNRIEKSIANLRTKMQTNQVRIEDRLDRLLDK